LGVGETATDGDQGARSECEREWSECGNFGQCVGDGACGKGADGSELGQKDKVERIAKMFDEGAGEREKEIEYYGIAQMFG